MKALTLINPYSRKRRRKTRRPAARRKTRRNPAKRRRAPQPYTVGSKRVRRLKLNPSRRRRRTPRRRTYAIARRRARRNPVSYRTMRPRRRRSARRNPFSIGAFITKDLVLMAAGGVASKYINDAVLQSTLGAKLPGAGKQAADAVYRLLIPIGASALVRKFGGASANAFGRGLVIGGLINSITVLVGFARATAIDGTGQYFPALYSGNARRNPRRALSPVGATPGYSATKVFGGMGSPFQSRRAFQN